MKIIWHDLECGSYREDLDLWRSLARVRGDPVLDVGAGTGRVTLELARAGHHVSALDLDGELLAELRRRAGRLPVQTVLADAREFKLPQRFSLCLAPMQTVQLLGGDRGRIRFLSCARAHLRPGGMVAVAISEELEPFEPRAGWSLPLPDICEHDGIIYSSQPTAVKARDGGYRLERRREVVDTGGRHQVSENVIDLDTVSAGQLEHEGACAGLRPAGRARIPSTNEYVGSTVVMLDG